MLNRIFGKSRVGEKFLPLVDPDHRMLEAPPSFNIDQCMEQTLESRQNS